MLPPDHIGTRKKGQKAPRPASRWFVFERVYSASAEIDALGLRLWSSEIGRVSPLHTRYNRRPTSSRTPIRAYIKSSYRVLHSVPHAPGTFPTQPTHSNWTQYQTAHSTSRQRQVDDHHQESSRVRATLVWAGADKADIPCNPERSSFHITRPLS